MNSLLETILVDAYGTDEQLWAFREAFHEHIKFPVDAFVIGQPVSLLDIDYDGNERRGLFSRCRLDDNSEYKVSLVDIQFSDRSKASHHVAAYRMWLGFPVFLQPIRPALRPLHHKAASGDIDLSRPVELIVLSVKERAARCRLLGSERVISLRAKRLWDLVPGEIVTLRPRKQWRYAGHPYLSGDIEGTRLDIAALGLVPLRIESRGIWDPGSESWGAQDGTSARRQAVLARGPRPAYEIEQVSQGMALDGGDFNPVLKAYVMAESGDRADAEELLMQVVEDDLRCLDAHELLGHLAGAHFVKNAIRHYAVAVRVGELCLGDDFDGLLPWTFPGNRSFLRCLRSHGLCLWRLHRRDEAAHAFDSSWTRAIGWPSLLCTMMCARARAGNLLTTGREPCRASPSIVTYCETRSAILTWSIS